jgi:hypothetical protein
MLFISGLILISQGCAKKEPEMFDQYLVTFQVEAINRGIDIQRMRLPTMHIYDRFPDSLGNTLGYCRRGDGVPSVHISLYQWNKMTAGCKERHIFHELGHCVLNKGHTEGGFSIMTTYQQWNCSFYENNRTASLDDLFERK